MPNARVVSHDEHRHVHRPMRPKHIGHWLEWSRTLCALLQVLLTCLVALRVFGIL
jgi:hypothetical protein